VEREVLLTGIGGQGVQLAARTLAVAAMEEGHQVMIFGSYGGAMRGGNTDATLIVSDDELASPPTIPRSWSAIAMHPEFWPPVRDRLRPGGFALLDAGLFHEDLEVPGCVVARVDATGVATAELGSSRAAAMVAIGAFAAATGLVGKEALVGATANVLPSYRAEHAAANAAAVSAGFALVPEVLVPAWSEPARAAVR
jgi:Pyruvate/2-oxoacid:ferredoxin oxidoreductase gamma subunit